MGAVQREVQLCRHPAGYPLVFEQKIFLYNGMEKSLTKSFSAKHWL